jgi:hypothetical protein
MNTIDIEINDKNLQEEINNVFNNLLKETCYIFFENVSPEYTLSATNNLVNIASFTYLIPNLFRMCYSQLNTQTPYICPTLTNSKNSLNYLPILIDSDLIKSFLYFNFPGSIKNYNNNYNFINSIYKYRDKKNMKKNSFIPSYTFISDIYSNKSLLFELLSLNNYIIECNKTYSKSLNICDYKINWDFTEKCISYSNNEDIIYTFGSFTEKNISINQYSGNQLYYYKNSKSYLYENESIVMNGFFILKNYSIYTIIDLAKEVYQDIVQEIVSFNKNLFFCKKKYMYKYNIPILLKIYKNYYNNQIYTISKSANIETPNNITPSLISIETYVEEFIKIYSSTYPYRYLIKTLYLNSDIENDAIVIYNTLGNNWGIIEENITINYWYYYINIKIPSPVEIFNVNNIIIDNYTTLTGVGSFSSDYNSEYTSKTSFTISKQIQYKNYGLYSNAGDITVGPNIDSILFYFVDSNNSLQSISLETLQSPKTNYINNGSDYGVPVPGIVLEFYTKI